MKRIALAFILLTMTLIVKSQNMPDSIVIIYSQHAPDWFDKGVTYFSDTISIIKNGNKYLLDNKEINSTKIKTLYNEIKNPLSLRESFYRSGIDTVIIKTNPLSLKTNYKENKYKWNKSQTSYISNELSNINNYIEQYAEYLDPYKSVSIPPYYENEIIIECFQNGILLDRIESNKSKPFRIYQFPWTNSISDDEYYNINLGEVVLDILNMKNPSGNLLQGKKLLNYLSSKVIESKRKKLLELSVNTYQSEVDELKDDFTIVHAREKTTYGGYTGDGGIIVLILQNEKMLPNIYFSVGLSIQKSTLYFRDSIKNDFQYILDKVQSITFISNYLKENSDRKLYIHYFNNKPINEYIYNHVIRTCVVQQLEGAITFELINENNDTSLWLLLPNDFILLFRMDGGKVLNYPYTQFGENKGDLYPCLRFDKSGEIVNP